MHENCTSQINTSLIQKFRIQILDITKLIGKIPINFRIFNSILREHSEVRKGGILLKPTCCIIINFDTNDVVFCICCLVKLLRWISPVDIKDYFDNHILKDFQFFF